jgi:hypothetical protein
MADDRLHDPWAPPPDPPGDPDGPTEIMATPATPTEPATVTPTEPATEPPTDDGRRRWPGSAKAVIVLVAVVLVGTAAALGYGWWKTNDDKKDLESASNQQGQELSGQLDKATKDLAAAQQQLTAADTKVTELEGQLKTAQGEAATAKAESTALTGLFPLNAQKVQPGLPGTYRGESVNVPTDGCSLASCPPVQLTLTIEASGNGLTVSDPELGRVPLTPAGGEWMATGPAAASFQLVCNGAPQATTFTLSFGAIAVALDAANAPRVTTVGGSLLLSSAAVAAVAEPPSAACPPGVGAYVVTANRT